MNWFAIAGYLLDHAAGLIGAVSAVWIAVRQHLNNRRNERRLHEVREGVLEVRHDLRNGIVSRHISENLAPVIEKVAAAAADKIVAQADRTACALAEKKAAWDGVERRTGPADRRGG